MRRFAPALLLASSLVLSSCSWFDWTGLNDDDAPPPVADDAALYAGCPKVAAIRELTIYQHPPVATDDTLVINTRMGRLHAKCGATEDGFQVDASFDILAVRGANSAGKLANLPFFVSVVNDKDEVLRRDLYEIPVTFEGDSREVRLTTPFSVSVPAPKDGAGMPRVLIGFHLSQDQLQANTDFLGKGQ